MARVPRIGRDGSDKGSEEREAGEKHFCPGCGAAQRPFERYPWYFCNACIDLAEDGQARRILFYNPSPLGGFGWCYADDTTRVDERAARIVCSIRKRPVIVHEARFGGIVAEPLHGGWFLKSDDPFVLNLLGPDLFNKAPERLLPRPST